MTTNRNREDSNMTMTDELVQTSTTDQPEQAAHIVRVPPGQLDTTPQAYVLRARIEGFEVTALCGYTWIPEKDPVPLPICVDCVEIYRQDPKGHGDRDRLPEA